MSKLNKSTILDKMRNILDSYLDKDPKRKVKITELDGIDLSNYGGDCHYAVVSEIYTRLYTHPKDVLDYNIILMNGEVYFEDIKSDDIIHSMLVDKNYREVLVNTYSKEYYEFRKNKLPAFIVSENKTYSISNDNKNYTITMGPNIYTTKEVIPVRDLVIKCKNYSKLKSILKGNKMSKVKTLLNKFEAKKDGKKEKLEGYSKSELESRLKKFYDNYDFKSMNQSKYEKILDKVQEEYGDEIAEQLDTYLLAHEDAYSAADSIHYHQQELEELIDAAPELGKLVKSIR